MKWHHRPVSPMTAGGREPAQIVFVVCRCASDRCSSEVFDGEGQSERLYRELRPRSRHADQALPSQAVTALETVRSGRHSSKQKIAEG